MFFKYKINNDIILRLHVTKCVLLRLTDVIQMISYCRQQCITEGRRHEERRNIQRVCGHRKRCGPALSILDERMVSVFAVSVSVSLESCPVYGKRYSPDRDTEYRSVL